jgi:mono/diheme cytochrome c family protein
MWVVVLALAGCGKKPEEPAAVGSGSGPASITKVVEADPPKPAGSDPAILARGEYMAAVTACAVCHTPLAGAGPDPKMTYAGGFDLPEGKDVLHSPNISPSKSSGIGAWTDEQILAAIREGLRPDGSHLHPLMPFMNYNRMTDADGKALVTYLRTVKAIDNVVDSNKQPAHEVSAPKPANAPDPTTDKVKHGEYLATLMHCNACHTPMTPHGPDTSRMYAGGMTMVLPMLGTGELHTSNLTSDPETGLGKWTEEQIAQSLKTMTRPDGRMIQGPMLLYQAYWSKLTDDDLHAIAAFVKQLAPIKNAVPASTFKMKGM